ncbi:MAG: GNAT family N-acetyltransferase [Cyclobacteriaceae bacterium]
MSESINLSEFQDSDFDSLLQMALKLWQDFSEAELRRLLKEAHTWGAQKIIMAKNNDDKNIGFAIFTIRREYVEGAKQSPTGYLEGIFVEADFRKKGIAKELVKLGEQWAKANGCIQMGSDTWLADKASRKFHQRIGFWEEEEVVHFLKDIE